MKKNIFTNILAVAGVVLVWFTLLAPVLLWVIFTIQTGRVSLDHFDYLLPAELFPVNLVGGLLLYWAARRAQASRALIVWGLGVAILSLVGSQALAVLTGLASGATPPEGWQWTLLLALLALYTLALVAIGIGGLTLLRFRFTHHDIP